MPVAALTPTALLRNLDTLFSASAAKIEATEAAWRPEDGVARLHRRGPLARPRLDRVDAGLPVRLGAAAVRRHRRDATSSSSGARARVERMAPHLTHVGVHDHGFNNVSTYGTLWRLAARRPLSTPPSGSVRFYDAGAEGQRRGAGAALDADPGRRLHLLVQRRALAVRRHDALAARAGARRTVLGHRLVEEQDAQVNLLERLVQHARATADFSVYYGTRTRHLRSCAAGPRTRACSTSPTAPIAARAPAGLLAVLDVDARPRLGDARLRRAARVHRDGAGRRARRRSADARWSKASCARPRRRPATSTSTMRRRRTASPTGTPARPGSPRSATGATRPADPFNDHEPVDSSAAAIAAQGLLRLGHVIAARDATARRYTQAGLRVVATLTRSGRPVSQHRRRAPRPAAALGLSLAERVGPRAAGRDACRAASRASGATTTCAKSRSTCGGWRPARRT